MHTIMSENGKEFFDRRQMHRVFMLTFSLLTIELHLLFESKAVIWQ